MTKYIDADLLRKEIEFAKSVYDNPNRVVHGVADAFRQDGRAAMCDDILKKIDSIQQDETQVDKMLCSQVWWEEQGWIMIPPDATVEGIDSLLRQVKKKLQQEQPESSKGKFVFPKFLYARTTNNKTIDVSYAPQSLDAVEYIRHDALLEWLEAIKVQYVVRL